MYPTPKSPMKIWLLIIGTILLISCNSKPVQYLSDKDIVILEENNSNFGRIIHLKNWANRQTSNRNGPL
jgi:hypothetical protein